MNGIVGGYLDIHGYRTYYETSGHGPAIVFVHMAGADSRQYRHVLPAFAARGYLAISVDTPGHGRTYPRLDTLHIPDTAHEWIDFVWGFIESLRLNRPVIVGGAMSASVLLQLAAQQGARVAGIVCAGGTANRKGKEADFLAALRDPSVNWAEFMTRLIPNLVGPDVTAETLNECVWLSARSIERQAFAADIAIFNAHDIRHQLASHPIKAPVLHLLGTGDPVVGDRDVEELRRLIPGLRTAKLTGVGHFPMLEAPQLFIAQISAFLADLAAGSAGLSD